MTKNESKPSIQCDKCHKWIKYNYYSGYGHRCSGRAEEVRRAAHRRFYSINRIQHFGVRSYEMARLGEAMYSVSTMYAPEANKLLRKDVEMNNRKRNQVERLVRSIDRAEKRILYLERLKRNDDHDIIIRHKAGIREPEVIENGYEIINQIIHNYRQSLERYNKELDELLAPETTGNQQYIPPKDKRWRWWKEG